MELPASEPLTAGERLRQIRIERSLKLKDVERQSHQIAIEKGVPAYALTSGRLSQIENGDSIPGVFKIASLSLIYDIPYEDILQLYGIEPKNP